MCAFVEAQPQCRQHVLGFGRAARGCGGARCHIVQLVRPSRCWGGGLVFCHVQKSQSVHGEKGDRDGWPCMAEKLISRSVLPPLKRSRAESSLMMWDPQVGLWRGLLWGFCQEGIQSKVFWVYEKPEEDWSLRSALGNISHAWRYVPKPAQELARPLVVCCMACLDYGGFCLPLMQL